MSVKFVNFPLLALTLSELLNQATNNNQPYLALDLSDLAKRLPANYFKGKPRKLKDDDIPIFQIELGLALSDLPEPLMLAEYMTVDRFFEIEEVPYVIMRAPKESEAYLVSNYAEDLKPKSNAVDLKKVGIQDCIIEHFGNLAAKNSPTSFIKGKGFPINLKEAYRDMTEATTPAFEGGEAEFFEQLEKALALQGFNVTEKGGTMWAALCVSNFELAHIQDCIVKNYGNLKKTLKYSPPEGFPIHLATVYTNLTQLSADPFVGNLSQFFQQLLATIALQGLKVTVDGDVLMVTK